MAADCHADYCVHGGSQNHTHIISGPLGPVKSSWGKWKFCYTIKNYLLIQKSYWDLSFTIVNPRSMIGDFWMHSWIFVCIGVADVLVLQHQGISIPNTDWIPMAFDQHDKNCYFNEMDQKLFWKKMLNHQKVNSLWPSDTIWRQRSGSTLVQVMACCRTAPSHYLNQCWLIISEVQWHSY